MPLDMFYAAGSPAVIECTAYPDSAMPLFWVIESLFHLPAKFLVFPLPVWGCTDQSLVTGAPWEFQGTAKLGYRVLV